jgi:hypothetical protein
VLSSNELWLGAQRTQLLFLCVYWNVYTESLPNSGSIQCKLLRGPDVHCKSEGQRLVADVEGKRRTDLQLRE